jgi:hypothetical protein
MSSAHEWEYAVTCGNYNKVYPELGTSGFTFGRLCSGVLAVMCDICGDLIASRLL